MFPYFGSVVSRGVMDICRWEEKGHRYEVSFPAGTMRVVCSSRRDGGWQPDFDDAVRAEDLQYFAFEDKGYDSDTGSGTFPRDFLLFVRYDITSGQGDRSRKRDGSRKLWWRLRCLDSVALAQLLEGLVELARSSPLEFEHMEELELHASQARQIVEVDERKRAADEAAAAEAAAIGDVARRSYGMGELERVESHTSFLGPMDVFEMVVAVLVVFAFPYVVGDVAWLSALLDIAFPIVIVVVLIKAAQRDARIKSQQLLLGSDDFMLIADDLGRRRRCWYTEGFDDPPRITRVEGCKVRGRKIVLRGRFCSGTVGRSDQRLVLQGAAGAGSKVDEKLVIWRTFVADDEHRLLETLDRMVAS